MEKSFDELVEDAAQAMAAEYLARSAAREAESAFEEATRYRQTRTRLLNEEIDRRIQVEKPEALDEPVPPDPTVSLERPPRSDPDAR